jgi:hypothetical protein
MRNEEDTLEYSEIKYGYFAPGMPIHSSDFDYHVERTRFIA